MVNIKKIRKEKGISVKDLANKVGISQSYMTRIENGDRELSFENALNISDALGTSLYDLVITNNEVNSLIDLRSQIDSIDRELAILFNKRMQTVDEITRYKQNNNIPIYDKAREDELIKKNIQLIDERFKDAYIKYLDNILTISKEYQKKHITK